jgi:hypothetical protein
MCAEFFDAAVLDASSGRCCDGLDQGGACVGPKDPLPPPNWDYGWPDHYPALIVEGPAAYKNGPPVWADGSEVRCGGWPARRGAPADARAPD